MIFREAVSPTVHRAAGTTEAVGTLTQRLRVTLCDNSVGVLH